MNLSGNTILITGGASGIGRGLAEAFHREGSKVIIAGRRQALLDEVTQAHPGMTSLPLDVASSAALEPFAAQLLTTFPDLNAVVHNAGVARPENLKEGATSHEDVENMLHTNILGILRLNALLLPRLLAQPRSTVVTVSSGLGFVPLAAMPTYSATKAFVHSWTESLRYQLKGTSVDVLEIIPPYVQTELGGSQQLEDPRAMPLADFIAETMKELANPPESGDILVERAHAFRDAERSGSYQQLFRGMNDSFH